MKSSEFTPSLDRTVVTRFGPRSSEPPLVSVLMIAYNHERYVADAIESVLDQVVNAQIELVIGEDCSSDRTRSIIRESCGRSGIPIQLVTADTNIGMHANFKRVVSASQGSFVAILEGDDRWIASEKLQTQLDFIRSRDDVQGVAHRAVPKIECVLPGDTREGWGSTPVPDFPAGELKPEMLVLFKQMIPTASLVLRRSIVELIPEWVTNLAMIDCYLTLKASLTGGLYLLDACFSEYRVTGVGAMARAGYFGAKIAQIDLLRFLLRDASVGHVPMLLDSLRTNVFDLADAFEAAEQGSQALHQLELLASCERRYGAVSPKTSRWIIRLRYPKLCRWFGGSARRFREYLE